MPLCIKCGGKFPNKIKIDGKVHVLANRTRCLICTPFKSHRGWYSLDGTSRKCLTCGKAYIHYRKKGHLKSKCSTCDSVAKRRGHKARCVAYKGGSCVRCGYNRSVYAMDFHHRNPKDKKFTISGDSYSRKWVYVMAELDKCDLLCANCHREIHEAEILANQT